MPQNPVIVFVCEHGAAKSVIAAAYFNKLAREENLSLHAIARGTHPDQEFSPIAVAGLHEDQLTPTETVPQKLSLDDLETAERIVSFCALPSEFQQKVKIEQWNDIPPVGENYERARNAIIQRIQKLLNNS